MSIFSPPKNWFRPPKGAERLWIGIALLWCITMFVAMPYWHFKGKQNHQGESYSTTPEKFWERVQKFVQQYRVDEVATTVLPTSTRDKGRYLLTINAKYQKAFEQGLLPNEIKTAFQQKGYPLSTQAKVKKKEDHWVISDSPNRRKYVAILTENEDGETDLDIYRGIPLVEPPTLPGQPSNAYLIGRNWQWYPYLKLKANQTYRLHISSGDFQHGFSLLPLNMNFQILPGYDHVLTLTPTSKGTFEIICNEFCGAEHHLMTGIIIVE